MEKYNHSLKIYKLIQTAGSKAKNVKPLTILSF